MTQKRAKRRVRAAAGISWLLLVGCHVDSSSRDQEAYPLVSTPAAERPAGQIVVESEFEGEPDVSDLDATTVLSIQPTIVESIAGTGEDSDDCKGWTLRSDEAEALFAMSQTVDARAWHEDYGEAPCTISGTLRSGGVEWQFSINGAAKAKWTHGTTVRYLGCGERECEAFGA